MSEKICDMQHGVYRRIYAGMRTGKRINAVSVDAALLFWHLHAATDDFGNLMGDTDMCRIEAAPRRRDWDDEKVTRLLDELATTTSEKPLIRFYEAEGERYIHISDFLRRQPANRNGRRIRKYPASPFEDKELAESETVEESRGVLGNPGGSRAPQNHTQNQSESENQTQPQNHHQSDSEVQAQSQNDDRESDALCTSTTQREGRTPSTGVGSNLGGGVVGGFGQMLNRTMQDLAPNDHRFMAVQKVLAEAGVEDASVMKELCGRKDITADLIRREFTKVKKSKDVDNPAAVLVHRLRNYRY